MAERGALPLLRPSLPRPSIFLSFSNLRASRFQKPISSSSRSPLLYSLSSTVVSVKVTPLNRRRFIYKIRAVAEEEGRYGRTVRGKRGRKRRQLWEELLKDNVEEDDDDDGDGGNGKIDLWKILEEIVDNVWILKAFKSYGYLLPFILLSLFFSTGPKAFLISLGVAIGPSLLFLAFQKLVGWDKRRRTSTASQFGVEMEDERRSRVRYSPSQVRNSGSAGMASNFGGWDELEGPGTVSEQPRTEPRRKPMKKRKKIRREEAAEAQPLLLRLLLLHKHAQIKINRTEPVKRLVMNLRFHSSLYHFFSMTFLLSRSFLSLTLKPSCSSISMANLTTKAKARLRGVVFDMDGTLTVPVIDFAAMYRSVLGEDEYKRIKAESPAGIDILHYIESWSPDKQQKAYEIIADYEQQGIDKLQIMPGAVELCSFLDSKKIKRGLITRNVKKAIDIFHQRFDVIFSPALGREFRPYKPNPDPLLHICSAWDIQPNEVMMVGDSLKDDIACGKGAGAFTCLLDETGRYGPDDFSVSGLHPDFKVDSLSKIQNILETNFDLIP
ncbi:unnamed protein product [Brassica rapa subsp. narinosa]